MPPRNPFKFPKLWRKLDDLKTAFEGADKHPPIGVTQGGSSRKNRGAKPAATTAQRPANLQERNK